jgi:hypothetical protein
MTDWNFDTRKAPRGKYVVKTVTPAKGAKYDTSTFVPDKVILATKCGKVTVSHYIPGEKRWMMLGKGEEPVAWQPYPEHPHSLPAAPAAADTAGASLLPVPAGQSVEVA